MVYLTRIIKLKIIYILPLIIFVILFYSLPKIVGILNGSPSLRVALNDLLQEWKDKGSDFWIVRNEAALKENAIANLIKKLRRER